MPPDLAKKIRRQDLVEGERKQISVLFADVVGSMDLAEQLGAERWRRLMTRVFALLSRCVHQFEGTVQDFTGDGIMALFGAPIAHEDHAQRACHAALQILDNLQDLAAEIRAESEVELALRIGINSGEVVVGAIGEDLRLEYTAIGHAVGLAQRMESLAEPGTACLTSSSAALVSGYFELTERGVSEVKGASQPQQLFRLERVGRALDKLERSRAKGLAGFVGRSEEQRALRLALEQSLRGQGQAVGLCAEAGIGKSRLTQEFISGCPQRGLAVYEIHNRSAYGRALPLSLLKGLLRAYLGISEHDPESQARNRIDATIATLDRDLEGDRPLLLDLLGLADSSEPSASISAEARERRLMAAMRVLVGAMARLQPTVTVVEDLHWMDPESRPYLDNLVASIEGTRSLLLLTYRPEYRFEPTDDLPYRELSLPPLGPAPLAELITELLGSDPSLDDLSELLADQTRGNPFFVEEAVAELAASGALAGERGGYQLRREIRELEIPASVQATLAARIDRLTPDAKSVLQEAATIGGEFDYSLLASIVSNRPRLEASISELLAAGFVNASPTDAERHYKFRHPLIRELAYESQLMDVKARTHAAIADSIQELEPQRLDERAGLIATHYEAAGDALAAARWYVRAGGAWPTDPVGAERHLRAVRRLDSDLPQSEEADSLRAFSRLVLVGTASRLGGEPDEIWSMFSEGRAAAERIGNKALLAMLYGQFAYAVVSCEGDAPRGAQLCDEAARFAEEVGDPAVRIPISVDLIWPYWLVGRYEDSLAAGEEVMRLTRHDPQLGAVPGALDNPRAIAAALRAAPLMRLGRIREARAAVAEGLELSERWSEEGLVMSLVLRCFVSLWGGDPVATETLVPAHRAEEIAGEIGGSFIQILSSFALGGVEAQMADLDAAKTSLKRCLGLIEGRRAGRDYEPTVRRFQAEVSLAEGELESAVSTGEHAVQMADERGLKAIAAEVRYSLARSLIARDNEGDANRALALLDEGEAIAEELGARLDIAQIARTRAELRRRQGEEEGYRRAREVATRLAQDLDARGLLTDLGLDATVGADRAGQTGGSSPV